MPKSPQPITPATHQALPTALSAAAAAAAAVTAASMPHRGRLPLLDEIIRRNTATPTAPAAPLVTFSSATGPAVTLSSTPDTDTPESATEGAAAAAAAQLSASTMLAQAAADVAID